MLKLIYSNSWYYSDVHILSTAALPVSITGFQVSGRPFKTKTQICVCNKAPLVPWSFILPEQILSLSLKSKHVAAQKVQLQPEEWSNLPPETGPADSLDQGQTQTLCDEVLGIRVCNLGWGGDNTVLFSGAKQRSTEFSRGEGGERGANVSAGSEEGGLEKMTVSSFS